MAEMGRGGSLSRWERVCAGHKGMVWHGVGYCRSVHEISNGSDRDDVLVIGGKVGQHYARCEPFKIGNGYFISTGKILGSVAESAVTTDSYCDAGWEITLELLPGGGISRYAVQPLGTWASQFNGGHDPDWPVDEPGPLVVRDFGRPPLLKLEQAAREWLGWLVEQGDRFAGALDRLPGARPRTPSGPAIEDVVSISTRPGRKGHDPLMLALVARSYVAGVLGGHRKVVAQMAEAQGVSPATVQGWLNTARNRGFLTRAPAGRPGGELTDEAKELLEANGHDWYH